MFLDLPPENSDLKTSRVIILPLPLDITASWKRGTDEGPAAIIEASHHIELYDEEVGFDPSEAAGGIATHPTPDLPTDPGVAMKEIEHLASGLLREDSFLISLGGEHSVTYPLVKAHQNLWPDLCVLQIDAHADLRGEYRGSPYNHGCPMRRIMELGVHVTAVGIRSVDQSEAPLLNGELRRTYLAHDVADQLPKLAGEIVDSLPSKHVYITIDLDGLDPSVVPAVGTPVPGGLGWWETLKLLRALAEERTIVGADVVELSPREGLHNADSVAARLVYKLIAYRQVKAGCGT